MERVMMMDCGDAMRRADNGSYGKYVAAKAADFTLKAINTGGVFSNRGAAGAIIATLPTAKHGLWFTFVKPTAQTFTVTAAAGAKIDGGTANGSIVVSATGGATRVFSDGTDWYSQPVTTAAFVSGLISGDLTVDGSGVATLADGLVHTASVTITNAQLKALRATPITIVAAPGANKINSFVSGTLVLLAGANVLTETGANLALKYNSGAGVAVSNDVEATGFIDQAVSTATSVTPKLDAIVAVSAGANKTLVLHNVGGGEIAGNAAADATLLVHVAYRIRPTA